MIGEYQKGVRSKKIVRIILIPFIVILLVLLLLKLGPGIAGKAVLPIKKVQIYGNHWVISSEIIQLMKLDTHSSILFLNLEKASSRILLDKRIKGARMVRVYPDTLRIHVVEKERTALVKAGESVYWATADGTVLSIADERGYSNYPFITLKSNYDDIKSGCTIGNIMVVDLLNAVSECKKVSPDFLKNIRSFSVDESGISVNLNNEHYRVYLGSSVSMEKLTRLRALISVLNDIYDADTLSDGSLIEIDMSFSHAAVRKREPDDEL